MSYLNIVMIEGNLTYDSEVKNISQGLSVTSFTLANNENFTNGKNEVVTKTSFIKVEVWGESFANKVSGLLKKGTALRVIGKLRSDSWVAEDGTKKERVFVRATNVDFIRHGQSSNKSYEAKSNDFKIDDIEVVEEESIKDILDLQSSGKGKKKN